MQLPLSTSLTDPDMAHPAGSEKSVGLVNGEHTFSECRKLRTYVQQGIALIVGLQVRQVLLYSLSVLMIN